MKKSKNNVIYSILILIVLFAASIYFVIPVIKDINFGLDLQGGFEVLYQVKNIDGSDDITPDMLNSTYKTISKRIDVLGVSEPSIVVEGDDKVRVGLAGVSDPNTARNILSKAASLTFRDTSDNLLMTSDVLKSGGAKVGQDSNGRPAVSLSVNDKDTFFKVTKAISESKDNRIVIWLDFDEAKSFASEGTKCGTEGSSCLSVASVNEGFASDVIIQGNFTTEEVSDLVELINSGSLPTKLEEISSKTIDASFGADSLSKTFLAGLIGIVAIMVVLVFLYHVSGAIASVCVAIYTFLLFLIFWVVGGVLTLPGIAAIVIGIGMAVDSCVISFSRIKDELKLGSKLSNAVKNGNKESFMTIFDANITTLIVAIILFIFGESSVKGFATMLIISIFVTMFVMVFVVRWLVNMFVNTGKFNNKLRLFINYKSNKKGFKVNFIKWGKPALIGFIVLIIAGIVSIMTLGFKLGIDFNGGSSISIKTDNVDTVLTEDAIKSDIASLNYTIYEYEQVDDNHVYLKINDTLSKDQVLEAESYFSDKYEANTNIGVVSNIVKRDLVKNAIISIIIASIGIIIYVTCRFQFSYAISGIAALVHDVLFIVTLFSIFRLEVSGIFIAAILSIIGYSINDTIVTFDRIKENIKEKYNNKLKKKEELDEAVDLSLNQTLDRSIVTTVTTLLPVIALIIFGSKDIINFNLALLFGLVSGVYSSLLLACQLWRLLTVKELGKPPRKKWYEEDGPQEKKVKGVNS